jgi:O-antigen/teichoic acid export membrane protein
VNLPRTGGLAGLLARNTLLNLFTQGTLMVIALWGINVLSRDLGESRFGLLTVLWTFVGYFGLLDFGISRAVTKFVADGLVDPSENDPRTVAWSSLGLATVLGIVAATALAASAGFWIGRVFDVPQDLRAEALRAFRLAAVGVPFMVVYSVLRGIQTACQRFGVINGIQLMIGVVQWAGAVIVLRNGGGLDDVLAVTIGVRMVAVAVSFAILPRMIPGLYRRIALSDLVAARKLLVFGGWVTVSQAISPLFSYLDRILLGTLAGLSAVAYYAVPQEALLRVLVVPLSLTTTLFPAMSQYGRFPQDRDRSAQLYYRSSRYLFLLVLPLCVVLFSMGDVILDLWVGPRYAEQSTVAFRILLMGLFVSSVAQIPAAALPAFGRPDLPAKFHLVELPVMLLLNIVLIPLVGITGVAITWTVRVVLDASLLFGGVAMTRKEEARAAGSLLLWRGLLVQFLWGAGLALVISLAAPISMRVGLVAAYVCVHVILVWKSGLDEADKAMMGSVARNLLQGRR